MMSRLDGLHAAAIWRWFAAVHEDNGGEGKESAPNGNPASPVTVEEPETEPYLGAELKFRIQSPPPVSPSQPGPAGAVGQSRGCGAVWAWFET